MTRESPYGKKFKLVDMKGISLATPILLVGTLTCFGGKKSSNDFEKAKKRKKQKYLRKEEFTKEDALSA